MESEEFSLLSTFESQSFGAKTSAYESIGSVPVDVADLPTPDAFRLPFLSFTVEDGASVTIQWNSGGSNVDIYWGDGTSTPGNATPLRTHTYTNASGAQQAYQISLSDVWNFGIDFSAFDPNQAGLGNVDFFWEGVANTENQIVLKDLGITRPMPETGIGDTSYGTVNVNGNSIPGPWRFNGTPRTIFAQNNQFTGPLPAINASPIKIQLQNNRFEGDIHDISNNGALTSYLVYNQEDGNTYSRIYPKIMLTGEIPNLSGCTLLTFYHVGAGPAWQRGFKNNLTVASDFDVAPALQKFFASNCQLSTAEVDRILNKFANVASTSPDIIDLSGTNGYPTAAGLADRDTLVAAGWTVNLPALS
jgi:hypothetical protein